MESINKTKEVSKSNPPVNKKCVLPYCHTTKLISEFEFGLEIKTDDHRSPACKACLERTEVKECHSDACITDKFMDAVYSQLEVLLALSEDGVDVPVEILETMASIWEQDDKNLKEKED